MVNPLPLRYHVNGEVRRVRRRMPEAVHLRREVLRLRREHVRHEALRIVIVEWEPGRRR